MDCFGVSSFQNLQALSALLSTRQDDDDDGEETQKNSKDIWSEEEVAEGSQYDDLADPRPQPEYDIILKQRVGTEDLFLGLSGKDPSSMCCESMLVKIKLPDTKATEVVLDVKEKFLDLRTPKYKLGLHLPHPIHSQEGKAQFFSEREELEVTLLLKRSMDFINIQ
uniref:PIH1 domain containing 3 n=1 Tax=Echeneis naucrates TaxID=173247 RepID=A0A665XDU0_ECHNA